MKIKQRNEKRKALHRKGKRYANESNSRYASKINQYSLNFFKEQEDGELSDGEINSPEPMDIAGKVSN